MEARCLMIGDYVQMKVLRMNKVFEKESVMIPYKVVEVRERLVLERLNVEDDDDRYTTISSSYVVEPIPLTREILEKNGFEKRWQDSYEYFNDDEGLSITFHPKSSNYTNGAYDYIDIERGCLTINELPISFVHELQHALRLCGTSKEIEL